MRPFRGSGLAAQLLVIVGMVAFLAFVAPVAGAAVEHKDSSASSGFDPHAKRCAKVDDPRPDRPKFCDGGGGGVVVQEPPTAKPPPDPPSPPIGVTESPVAPAVTPPAPISSAAADAGGVSDGGGASSALSALFGQADDVTDDAPVAIGPSPTPDLPFGFPPVGGGLDDEGIPTGVYVVIALAAAAAAAMVARGGLGRRTPFLTVPDDGQQMLPFE